MKHSESCRLPTTHPSSMPKWVWILLGSLAFFLGGFLLYAFVLRDTWERDNFSKIMQMKSEAATLAVNENLEEALAIYEDIFHLIGQREIKGTTLKTVIDEIHTHYGDLKNEYEKELYQSEEEFRQREVATYGYEIIKKEDVSYRNVVRIVFHIRIDEPVDEAKLRHICEEIIEHEKPIKPCNAIAFWFFLPGEDARVGMADWAPNGSWEQAGNVPTGDYSTHKLVIEVGYALGVISQSDLVTSIPKSKRMQIFYDTVVVEDQGMAPGESDSFIAKKYGIDLDTVMKISVEGIKKGWPMP